MTKSDGSPTWAGRVLVLALAAVALVVGALWLWTASTGVVYAGMPPWAIGLVVVALLFGLAALVHRVHGNAR